MTLVLELPEETELRLREAAHNAGRAVEAFIVEAAVEKAALLPTALNAAQAALALDVSPAQVERLLGSGRLSSLAPSEVVALANRYRAANRALDEIVATTEALGLYEHQK